MRRSTKHCGPAATARSCSPIPPTTPAPAPPPTPRAAAPLAIPLSLRGGSSSAASAMWPSARYGTRSRPASRSTPVPARRLGCALAGRTGPPPRRPPRRLAPGGAGGVGWCGGGRSGRRPGQPLDLLCGVGALRPDMVMTGLAGAPANMGDCALVEAEGLEIVLCSIRHQAIDTDLFTQLGCVLGSKAMVVVKSAQHFYASFDKIAAEVIYVDAPGVAAQHTSALRYTRIRRPRWPIDAVATPLLMTF